MFTKQHANWQRRKRDIGDRAVGNRDENVNEQAEHIARYVKMTLADNFYEHGLDFGCGWGRFTELLVQHCGHLWAIDIFADWLARATSVAATVSPVELSAQQLPVDDGSMDLVVDIMTLQSIDSDLLAREAMHELRRAARAGAAVISLHVLKPRAPTRTGAQRAAHLGLSKWQETVVNNIDRNGQPYSYLVGTRA